MAEEKVLDALVGKKASPATRESFRQRLRTVISMKMKLKLL